MKRYFLPILLSLFFVPAVLAQRTFLLKNASKTFDVKIAIAGCEEDTCEGKATVSLIKKGNTDVFQTIRMANLFLELGADQKPTANLTELYGENNSGVIFDDFNFDGTDDLSLRNGNDGAYGGPSYDVLLAVKKTGKFVRHAALTKLASDNLGMFEVDKRKKTIETFTKDGCCWHRTTRYKFSGSRLVKIYVFTEDAMLGDGKVRLITETLVKGKWRRTKKTVLFDKYYKDQ